jgi:hypothetical protein
MIYERKRAAIENKTTGWRDAVRFVTPIDRARALDDLRIVDIRFSWFAIGYDLN